MTDTLPSALATGGVGAVDGFGLPAGTRQPATATPPLCLWSAARGWAETLNVCISVDYLFVLGFNS